MRNSNIAFASTLIVLLTFPLVAETTGRIVLSSDDRMLSDAGFVPPNTPDVLATNVANWFTAGNPGSFLVWSNNAGLTGSQLALAMTAAGHSWTVSTSGNFDLARLQSYDAVFLGGVAADTAVLTEYVNAGGNVYLMVGTGAFGDYANEAAAWEPFVLNFGLSLSSASNEILNDIPVGNAHPVTSGVSSLAYQNGQTILELDPNSPNPNTQSLITIAGEKLLAVSEFTNFRPPNDNCSAAIPISNGSIAFSNLSATTDGPFEEHPCQATGSDIWFRYYSACAGVVFLDLCESNFDTQVLVYVGCPTEAGQLIGCDDDGCTGQTSQMSFLADGGVTYLIRIGGFEGSQGSGTLVVSHTGTQFAGDVNLDGVVNLQDLATLLAHFGLGPNPPQSTTTGDIDGDFDVDLSDLAILLANFGSSCQ